MSLARPPPECGWCTKEAIWVGYTSEDEEKLACDEHADELAKKCETTERL